MEALETMCKCFEILCRLQSDYAIESKELNDAIKKLETDITNIILSSHLEISH